MLTDRRLIQSEKPNRQKLEIDWTHPHARNLVVAVPMFNDGRYVTDLASGQIAYNVANNAFDAPAYYPSPGPAHTFDGSTTAYSFGDIQSSRQASRFTLMVLCRLTTQTNGVFPRMFSKLSDNPYGGYELLVRSPNDAQASKPYIQIGKNNGSLVTMNGTAIATNDLLFFVATYSTDTGVLETWQATNDGACTKIDSSNIGGSAVQNSTASFTIGRWPGQSTNYFTGQIFDVRIYDDVCPDDIITDIGLPQNRFAVYRPVPEPFLR